MSSIINASNTGFGGVITTGDSSGQLQLQTAGTTAVTLDTSQNATFAGKVTSAGALTLASNGSTTAVTIDTSQNVGIGQTSPNVALVIERPSNNAIMRLRDSTASVDTYFISDSTGTTINLTSALPMIFKTTNTERMRIDSNGYALIGYTSSNGAYKLQVNSQIFATSSTIATSDARYKTNIEPITSAIELVNKLNPVSFDWKEHPIHEFPEGKTIGFLAQEVQEVLKDTDYVDNIVKTNECVISPEEKDEDGNVTKEAVKEEFLGIAEGNLIPLLTKAIQEQQTIINDLKARIETLEAK